MFIDTAEIYVRAGKGGDGAVSFRREKFVPKGGPDGGDGGDGGDVVVVADSHIWTLMDLRYRREYIAEDGHNGSGARKTGRRGKDAVIRLPVGTIVRNVDSGEIIADLTEDGQTAVIAKHGRGGRGNSRFATATTQAPRKAENGRPGEECRVELELRLLADVGLVGFPNAGKSTLISRISQARPKIADYPFTTLVPNLGIVRVDVGASFVVADIPGLIEGASTGKGLGDQFLRHVERSAILCFLLDGTNDDPAADYAVLKNEILTYNPALADKQRVIVITKADAIEDVRREQLGSLVVDGVHPLLISSVSGEGIDPLVDRLATVLTREQVEGADQ